MLRHDGNRSDIAAPLCVRCGGRRSLRSLISFIQDPPFARGILTHLGMSYAARCVRGGGERERQAVAYWSAPAAETHLTFAACCALGSPRQPGAAPADEGKTTVDAMWVSPAYGIVVPLHR